MSVSKSIAEHNASERYDEAGRTWEGQSPPIGLNTPRRTIFAPEMKRRGRNGLFYVPMKTINNFSVDLIG